MKSNISVLTGKTTIVVNRSLIPFVFLFVISSILFPGCKKESSSENSNPVITSAESKAAEILIHDSTAGRTEAVLATIVYEGFGANAVGGSTSTTVYHVTNLNSSGAGSLANGIGSNRTIVFDVSGTITGRFDLIGISYLTIDGTGQNIIINNNNNGDGISFDGSSTHHCILMGIHVTNAGNDGINALDGAHDIMITNCSSYNNVDGEIDIAGATNVTIQYCILGASASGGPGCMLITATNVTAHHNLFSPAAPNTPGERCPLVHCNYSPVGNPNADIRNNIIWKFGRNNGTGTGYGSAIAYNATGNIINNYYYTSGPSTNNATSTSDGYGSGATGKAYMAGNVSGNSGANPNGPSNHAIYPAATVTTQDACTAAALVLANAGPRPLNATDQALINAVALTGCTATLFNQPPIVNAGPDQIITLPVSSVTLTGTASDPDGTIVSYLWTMVSGTGGTITTVSAATTTVTGLTAGTYVYNLKVTDNGGATASDNITIIVNPDATNLPPLVNAGADQTITLPANSVTLTGTASDTDGTIASYLWTKVSGTGGTITTASAASTTVTGLTAGTYIYNLKVTDNSGSTASDNITITVNPDATTNLPPVVNAGTDQTIRLPVNSVTLTGTASDPDGTIASYLWTKVSGTGGVITTSAAASTDVTGLTAGSYVFNLKVTDNGGATASDNITVTVNPEVVIANLPPVVNAGTNQTITLPVNIVTLTGIASDPDGTIASYLWTKVSGTGGTITTASAASTTVTGLIAGSYVFNLKVTDNLGATASDNITVTVNPLIQIGLGYGTLTYSQPYDISFSVNTNLGRRNSVSYTTFLTGPGSFRSEVRAGDAGTRSEMGYTSPAQNPNIGVVEYDVYFENWNSFEGGGHTIEWAPQTYGGSAILSLQNYGGKFDVVRAIGATVTHQSGILMSCAPNTWYKMRWEYKWSTNINGYIRLYINNVLYYTYSGITADGSGQSLRIGQFRWPDSGNTMQTTSVCYYDNLKVYKR